MCHVCYSEKRGSTREREGTNGAGNETKKNTWSRNKRSVVEEEQERVAAEPEKNEKKKDTETEGQKHKSNRSAAGCDQLQPSHNND